MADATSTLLDQFLDALGASGIRPVVEFPLVGPSPRPSRSATWPRLRSARPGRHWPAWLPPVVWPNRPSLSTVTWHRPGSPGRSGPTGGGACSVGRSRRRLRRRRRLDQAPHQRPPPPGCRPGRPRRAGRAGRCGRSGGPREGRGPRGVRGRGRRSRCGVAHGGRMGRPPPGRRGGREPLVHVERTPAVQEIEGAREIESKKVDPTRPLAGMRVLDLTRVLAGRWPPACWPDGGPRSCASTRRSGTSPESSRGDGREALRPPGPDRRRRA